MPVLGTEGPIVPGDDAVEAHIGEPAGPIAGGGPHHPVAPPL